LTSGVSSACPPSGRSEAAGVELEAEIRGKRTWNLLLPGCLSSGSVALAAATGSWGFASALLSAAAGIAGYGEHALGRRRNAAFELGNGAIG
jgi:hypothetical protein